MGQSGSETRLCTKTLSLRVTEAEFASAKDQAMRARVSVAALIRQALFAQAPLRAARQPSLNDQLAAQLGGRLGALTTALNSLGDRVEDQELKHLIEALHRDHVEMRAVWFEAFGRQP